MPEHKFYENRDKKRTALTEEQPKVLLTLYAPKKIPGRYFDFMEDLTARSRLLTC